MMQAQGSTCSLCRPFISQLFADDEAKIAAGSFDSSRGCMSGIPLDHLQLNGTQERDSSPVVPLTFKGRCMQITVDRLLLDGI
jgi:hypothetical protein